MYRYCTLQCFNFISNFLKFNMFYVYVLVLIDKYRFNFRHITYHNFSNFFAQNEELFLGLKIFMFIFIAIENCRCHHSVGIALFSALRNFEICMNIEAAVMEKGWIMMNPSASTCASEMIAFICT